MTRSVRSGQSLQQEVVALDRELAPSGTTSHEKHWLLVLGTILRGGTIVICTMLLGMMFSSPALLFPGGDPTLAAIAIPTGIFLPLFLSLIKIDRRAMWMACNVAVATATVLFINGWAWLVALTVLQVAAPASIVLSFFQVPPGSRFETRWRCELLALVAGLVLARSLGVMLGALPVAGFYALYPAAGLLACSPLLLMHPAYKNDENWKAWIEEQQRHDVKLLTSLRQAQEQEQRRGSGKWTRFMGVGIVLAAIAGATSMVPVISSRWSWVDVNPFLPGVARSVHLHLMAPFDTGILVTIQAVSTLAIVVLVARRPRLASWVAAVALAAGGASWWACFTPIASAVPRSVLVTVAAPLLDGGIIAFAVALLAHVAPPPPHEQLLGRIGGFNSLPTAWRAWVLVMPLLLASILGGSLLDLATVLPERNALLVQLPLIVIAATVGIIIVAKLTRGGSLLSRNDAYVVKARKGARPLFKVIGVVLLASVATTTLATAMNAPRAHQIEFVVAWGGTAMPSWAGSLSPTHVTVHGYAVNPANGEVTESVDPAIVTAVQNAGAEALAHVRLTGEGLHRLLADTSGMRETFTTSLMAVAIATGADGIALDFEHPAVPVGEEARLAGDWVSLFEAVVAARDAAAPGLTVASRWYMDGHTEQALINRYLAAVDIHVQPPSHGGTPALLAPGPPVVLGDALLAAREIHGLLADKALGQKVVVEVPTLQLAWIKTAAGTWRALYESDLIGGGADSPFMEHETISAVAAASGGLFELDPLSGCEKVTFTVTLTCGNKTSCMAWLAGPGLVDRYLHGVAGTGFSGVAFSPGDAALPAGMVSVLS